MISKSRILKNLAIRNLKLKYKQSILGFLWSMITPLVYLLIFNFVFSSAFPDIENYSLYVLTGLVFWQFFSNATNMTIVSFIANAGIIKTINIPIHYFPLATIFAELVSLLLTFVPFVFIMFFIGMEFTWHLILIIPIIYLFGTLSYGIGLFIGVLNVYLRDANILWNTLNPALFYLTPIAYSAQILPAKYEWVMKMNPLFYFFEAARDVLYRNQSPSLTLWLTIIVIAFGTWGLGKLTLKKLEAGIISNI